MTVFTEGRHPGEFLMTEANGQRSRENIIIASGSGIIAPGSVLGRFTSGTAAGKYSLAPAAAADPDVGNQVAAAVALYGCDATSADAAIAAIVRDAEVKGDALTYHADRDQEGEKASANADLAAAGILVR